MTTQQAKKLGRSEGFGVRLEDPVLVTAEGAVLITQGRARSPYEP